MVKICLQSRRPRFNPWVGKIPWRRERQPTPVFLPGESHGQRSPVGYGSWSHKELDVTEATGHNTNTLYHHPRNPVQESCQRWGQDRHSLALRLLVGSQAPLLPCCCRRWLEVDPEAPRNPDHTN